MGTSKSGVLQSDASTALCPWQRRFTIAEAGEKHDAGHRTAGIRRMLSQISYTQSR